MTGLRTLVLSSFGVDNTSGGGRASEKCVLFFYSGDKRADGVDAVDQLLVKTKLG
jgi:hypothetical protein